MTGLYRIIYIFTSSTSYSCANALPYYAQKDGLAKIIGAASGGGDCVVFSFIDAYSRSAVYSGFLKIGRDTGDGFVFVSDEKDIQLDFNMMPTILDRNNVPWFDPAGITDAVHQYQNGATEVIYNGKNQEERVTEYLNGLFDKIAENMPKNAEGN
ncbi:MAG: hypothetical protein IJJ29_01770 [Solobacterium sp.]|nr:hypothetical protein [Solobacterium sp.]